MMKNGHVQGKVVDIVLLNILNTELNEMINDMITNVSLIAGR